MAGNIGEYSPLSDGVDIVLQKSIIGEYDVNGNMIVVKEDVGGQVETLSVLTYNASDKLKTYIEDSLVTTMVYDGDGRRVRKTLEDTASFTVESDISYLYDGRRILYEVDETGLEPSVIANYVYGINLIAREEGISGSTAYYFYNGHGDVTGLVDIYGVLIGSFDYEAFGDVLEETGIGETPFKYAGEYFDKETGTIYLRARYYDPTTSRMLSPNQHWHSGNMVYGDNPRKMGNSIVPNIYAIMQSLNLYVYALNNPLLWIDPSGYKIELSSKATEAEKQAYERAIAYLQTSETAALIKLLMDSPEVFTIVFNNKLTANYVPGTRTINWDPTGGLVLGDGKSIMSPAMALAHEMGHGAQHLAGVTESSKSYNRKQILAIEEANLSSYETPIAKELGEYTRKNYSDAKMMYRASNSIDWGHLKSNVIWYKPWTWFRSPTFVNQNS